MSRLDLTFSEVYNQVSDFLGTGSSPTGSDLTLVKGIVYRAYRKFLYPIHPATGRSHYWSFLKKYGSFQTVETQWVYQLPLDFDRMLGNPQFDLSDGYPELVRVTSDRILNSRNYGEVSSFPQMYAIVSGYEKELGQIWSLWLYPTPNGVHNIRYQYLMSPQKPDTSTDYLPGGPRAQEVMLEVALAVAEQQEDGEVGIHSQLAESELAKLILSDTVSTAETVGNLYSGGQSFRRGSVPLEASDVYADESGIDCLY